MSVSLTPTFWPAQPIICSTGLCHSDCVVKSQGGFDLYFLRRTLFDKLCLSHSILCCSCILPTPCSAQTTGLLFLDVPTSSIIPIKVPLLVLPDLCIIHSYLMGFCSDYIQQRPSCLIFLYIFTTLSLTFTTKFTRNTYEILSLLSSRIYIIHMT